MLDYEMRWPVLDTLRDKAELLREATADLQEHLAVFGMRPLSAPVFDVVVDPRRNRHAGPYLRARLAVADYVPPVPE